VKINQNCLCKFLIGDLTSDIDEKKYEKAASDLKIYKQKWDEISKKASSSEEALIKEPEQEEESLQ